MLLKNARDNEPKLLQKNQLSSSLKLFSALADDRSQPSQHYNTDIHGVYTYIYSGCMGETPDILCALDLRPRSWVFLHHLLNE